MRWSHLPPADDGRVEPPKRSHGANPPTSYQIIARGELSRHYRAAFEGMTLVVEDGRTTITGPVLDQTHLPGLLDRVGDFGLEIVSFNAISRSPTSDPANRT